MNNIVEKSLQKPTAIIFDWDNTLVNTWPVIHKSLHETYVTFDKVPMSLDEVMSNVKYSLRDSFPDIFGEKWEEAREVFYQNFERYHLVELEQISGAQEFLVELRNLDIPLALVSNKTGKYLRKETEHLNWHGYFKNIVGAGDAKQDKPAIDPLYLALEGTDISLSESVWFVGDSEVDVKIAENGDLTGILLHFENKPVDMVAKPHRTLPDFNSLLQVISSFY